MERYHETVTVTLNHTPPSTGHTTQDVKQMYGTQRTPQDLVTI